MFKRLGAVSGVVKDSGAVEAITRGPDGFLQVMAFLWFAHSFLFCGFRPAGIPTDPSKWASSWVCPACVWRS